MLPVTTPVDATSAVAPLTPAAAPATATVAADNASAVDFSGLAQFLSTLALTRRQLNQLAQLQGGSANTPSAADIMLLNVAASNLTRSFKQLPPSVLATLPPLPDRQGGTLSERLALVLQQLGATAEHGGPISSSTLAGIGITLDPLAPASAADLLNVDAPLLRAAFAVDRNGTLALLTRTTDQFHALGIAVAQAEADAGATNTPAPTAAPPAAPGSTATLAHLALNDALAGTAADVLRRLAVSAQEEAAAGALAQRMAARKSTDLAQRAAALRQELDQVQSALELQAQQQLQAHLGQAGNLPRPPNAADPAQAAAIAAYSGPAMAAAGMRQPSPAAQSARVPGTATTPPVRPVQPVQPIGAPGGVNPDGTARTPR